MLADRTLFKYGFRVLLLSMASHYVFFILIVWGFSVLVIHVRQLTALVVVLHLVEFVVIRFTYFNLYFLVVHLHGLVFVVVFLLPAIVFSLSLNFFSLFSPAFHLGEFLFGIIYFICAPSFFPTYASSTFSFLSLEPCAAMPILKSVLFANMAPFAHVFWVRYLVTVSLQDTCLVFNKFWAMFITKHYKL